MRSMNKELKEHILMNDFDAIICVSDEKSETAQEVCNFLKLRGFSSKVITADKQDFEVSDKEVNVWLRGEFIGDLSDLQLFFEVNDFSAEDYSASDMMSNAKFFEAYSRWDESKSRYESWDEAVERVMNMHRAFYADKMSDELEAYISEAEIAYKKKYVLGAQRALQFGGDQLLKHQMRMYNCTASYADRTAFFGEFFYILLCGAGCGFSVQNHHIDMLPSIQQRKGNVKQHIVEDSIEGWATALDVMLSSFFVENAVHEEYQGRKVYFDLSQIRPKGSEISGGFKAPGPEPLRVALDKVEHLIQGLVLSGETRLKPIHVYDICMYAADAVLAGGVRRSATICLFSPNDHEMLNAKTGDWYIKNPQRGRSNNSAVIVRDEITKTGLNRSWSLLSNLVNQVFTLFLMKPPCNPCVEISLYEELKRP